MYRKRDANTETNTETNIETNTETNIETNTETNTENVGRIIRLMGEQPSITVKMIAQQLGLSVGGVRGAEVDLYAVFSEHDPDGDRP